MAVISTNFSAPKTNEPTRAVSSSIYATVASTTKSFRRGWVQTATGRGKQPLNSTSRSFALVQNSDQRNPIFFSPEALCYCSSPEDEVREKLLEMRGLKLICRPAIPKDFDDDDSVIDSDRSPSPELPLYAPTPLRPSFDPHDHLLLDPKGQQAQGKSTFDVCRRSRSMRPMSDVFLGCFKGWCLRRKLISFQLTVCCW